MDKKTLLWLFVGFMVTLAAVMALLQMAIAHGAISFSPSDRSAGPIVLSIAAGVGLLLLFVAALIGIHVYRDARKRGMEPLLWTLLTVFIPYFLGLIIYLIVRHPLQTTCPSCGARGPEKAAFCPSCGRPLLRACARCETPLENEARFCHACGQEVAAG